MTAIHNRLKRTISASGKFWLLQMVSELDTKLCVNKDTGPPKEVDCEISHQLEISVWKPLPSRRVLKP